MKIDDLKFLWHFNDTPKLFLRYSGAGFIHSLIIVAQVILLATITTKIYQDRPSSQDLVIELTLLLLIMSLRAYFTFLVQRYAERQTLPIREKRIELLIRDSLDGGGLEEKTAAERIQHELSSISSHEKYLSRYSLNLIATSTFVITLFIISILTLALIETVENLTIGLCLVLFTWELLVLLRNIGKRPEHIEKIQSPYREDDSLEEDEALTSLGRIKEIRWTDCEVLFGDDKSVTFGWGIASSGKLTAFVGPTGSGKTTLFRALMRDLQVSEGRIFVETSKGTFRLEELAANYWLNQLSWIPTTPYFLPGTIESNLKLIKPRANRERLAEILKTVNLDLGQLPQGLQTPVEVKDGGLTKKQCRQLALARTILKDSPIILVDAPLQELDAASQLEESIILKGLAREGKIVILITQDAESLTLVDRRFTFESDHRPPVRMLEVAQ